MNIAVSNVIVDGFSMTFEKIDGIYMTFENCCYLRTIHLIVVAQRSGLSEGCYRCCLFSKVASGWKSVINLHISPKKLGKIACFFLHICKPVLPFAKSVSFSHFLNLAILLLNDCNHIFCRFWIYVFLNTLLKNGNKLKASIWRN